MKTTQNSRSASETQKARAASTVVLTWVTFFLGVTTWAQAEPAFVEGDVIVRLTPTAARAGLRSAGLEIVRPLMPSAGIYLAKTIQGRTTHHSITQLKSMRAAGILSAQPNHYVTLRNAVTPNDPEFTRLWSLHSSTGVDVDAPEAWAILADPSTTGADAVVAVVDGGVDRKHPDLVDNIWTNSGEIPNNKIDDDGNGYVDDVNGWNAFAGNGTPAVDMHGTHVAGIVSAKGNNSLGIVGVNWNAKIMVVSASSSTTSIVLEGYNYVLAQKKLWIESHGAKGANVVATNSSFGVDYADCSSGEYPAWNAAYEEMGRAGILSAAATANLNIDVDVRGDVPTGCTSEYILSVTNTDNRDQRNSGAAFGLLSVDLGAPGTAIVSTLPNGKTGPLTGTSMATPHVAGAVAFMHSVANQAFRDLNAAQPALAALEIRRILLGSVDPIPSMRGVTVSGGRLNLLKAGLAIANYSPASVQ